MQQDQLSNAIALEIESADSDSAATQLPVDDSADAIAAASQGESAGGVGKLVSIFKIAAEDQVNAYEALSERIARLEQDEDSPSLRETVRELFEVVSGLAGEMDRRMSQAENRIAAVAHTVESLADNIASASSDLEQLHVAAQEKTTTLNEHLNSAEVRISQVENGITEFKGSDTKAFAAIDELSGNLDALKDKLSGGLNAAEVRVGHVENAISDLKASDTKAFATIDGLSENFTALNDKLSGALNSAEARVGQVEDAFAQQAGKNIKAFAAVDGLTENLELLKDRLSRDLNFAEARVVQVEKTMTELRSTDEKTFTAIDALSETLDFLDGKLAKEQREAAQLGDRIRLAEHKIANWTDCEARVATLSRRVSELRDIEKSLRDLQGQSDQASADICTLGEDMRVLHGGIGSVNTDYRQLKDRLEQAETGIAASFEQSQSLARLHARLAETFASKAG